MRKINGGKEATKEEVAEILAVIKKANAKAGVKLGAKETLAAIRRGINGRR